MAIAPIPNIYHGFTFAGEYSADYGVYIQEPAVFDAPERDVEMITIPGRDGELAFDKGRFRNIEVTYHCTLPAKSEGDFITGVANFRNMLASKVGYQRLEDDINTTEYRQAAFISGLAVNSVNIESGTFDVVFNCKPQRFLTTGETAIEVQDGDTITNPTLFDSKPMLQIWGDGTIELPTGNIVIYHADLGWVWVSMGRDLTPRVAQLNLDTTALNVGDTITGTLRDRGAFKARVYTNGGDIVKTATINGGVDPYLDPVVIAIEQDHVDISVGIRDIAFNYGTSYMAADTYTIELTLNDNTVETHYGSVTLDYDGDDTMVFTNALPGPEQYNRVWSNPWRAFSTKQALGSPLYIDLETGEAYQVINGEIISSNNGVALPAQLPTLKPGANSITYDNTITQLEIVPRWWTV